MKICFAINNLCAGGGERVFSSLVNEIAANTNHEIVALCFLENFYISRFFRLHDRVKTILFDRCSTIQLEMALLEAKPDVVVSFLNPMNSLISISAQKLNIPHIACERNNPYLSPMEDSRRVGRDKAFMNAAGCVFQTKEAASYFIGKTTGLSTIIPNPVVLDVSNTLTNNCLKEDKIVAVGRYAEQKDYFTMMKAFSLFLDKHPSYILECYGKDSGTLSDVLSFAESLGVFSHVVFNEETRMVHEKIQSGKVFLMTSLYEGLPNALAEAAALGLPCVASDIPGIRDLVEHYRFGILCPPKDADSFAEAMDRIVSDQAMAEAFSQNGKKLNQDRRIEIIAKQWLKFISNIVNNSNKKC